MQTDLKAEYSRIGKERDAGGKIADRARFWFHLRTLAWCWVWVVIGGVLMAKSLHINASVGPFYFPGLMAKAEAYWNGGLFIGTAGPIATLLFFWRRAINRGILD